MENIKNRTNLINFEKSDTQILSELLTELDVLDQKGIFQEGSIEILGSLTAKPNTLLTDFISKPQDVLYSKEDIEKREVFSVWDFYKETNNTSSSLFQVVGSSAFYFLGYANLVEQLKKVRIKKNNQSLWDILPLSITQSLEKLCQQRGKDVDLRIQKNDQYPNNLLDTAEQFLIKKLKPSSKQHFIDTFYTNRKVMSNENTLWTIQSFYYGNTTVDYCQFVKAPRTYRFIKEALLLEMDLDKDRIELKTKDPLILIQSLLDLVLKVTHSDLNNFLENNDLGMLAYNQSHFGTCSRNEDEESLIKHIFSEDKKNNTAKLGEILKITHKKHSNQTLSSLVCLLLNSLRICAPYIDQDQLIYAMKHDLLFSEKKSYIHILCDMLLQKIDFEKISSLVQVVAFAALHSKISIDKKKISLVKHRQIEHLQIGNENSILLKWDICKALKVVEEHFKLLSPFFSSCLLDLIDPINLSEHEIFFIAAHAAEEFELAFKKFSILNKKSKVLLGRVCSNPYIPHEQKLIYLSKSFPKKNNEQTKLILSELNAAASDKEKANLPSLPNFVIKTLLNIENKELYPHLISMMPLEKVHFVWEKQFQNIKDDQLKLLFFINAIECYHQFKLLDRLEAITPSKPSCTDTPFKINLKSSYIDTLCKMLLKSFDLEKISAALQIVFFTSIYEPSPTSPTKHPLFSHEFNVIQIGEEKCIFLKWDIKKAIQIVNKHFESLSAFLPLLRGEEPTPLLASEILFIAAHVAGEFKCALKISRSIKGSPSIAKRLAGNPNMPIREKILYLLEILNTKTPLKETPCLLSSLNELLMHTKNAPPLNLQEWCIHSIWKNRKEHPYILVYIPTHIIQTICTNEFKLIKGAEAQFNFIFEEVNFYKKFNINIELSAIVVPLYQELIEYSFSQEAAQLRALFKNEKEIQNKMPLPLKKPLPVKKKPQENWLTLLKNKEFEKAFDSFNFILASKTENFSKEDDETLTQLFSYVSELSLQKLNWKKLKQLKNLLKTKVILDNRLYQISLHASTIHQIELLQHHSNSKKLLLDAALRLKENLVLSKKCFQLILQGNTNKPLKENPNLNELFSAYIDENSLLWLLQYLPHIPSHFSIKQEDFLIFLNQLGCKLAFTLNHPKHIQTCIQWLLSHNIWTPVLAENFVILYNKLNNQKQIFQEPQKYTLYEKLFQNISSIELLDSLIPLCFTDGESFNPKASYFIDRLIDLLEKTPKSKENQSFILMQDTLLDYLDGIFNNFIENGCTQEARLSLISQCAYLSTYLQEDWKEKADHLISESILISALFEKNLNFFHKLCEIYLKGKNNNGRANFLYKLFCNVTFYITNLDKTKQYLKAYQTINNTSSNSFSFKKYTPAPSCTFKDFKQIESEICEWLYGSIITASPSKFNEFFYSRLKDLYLHLKDAIIDLVEAETNLSTCLDLAINWTLTQFRFEDKSLLPQLRDIMQVLVKKIDPFKLDEVDYIPLIQLLSISNIFFKQQEKEKIKQLPNFENKLLSILNSQTIDIYKFQLINEIIAIQNEFSLVFFYEYLQENISAMAKITNKWKTYLEPDWTDNCNNKTVKAMRTIYNYAIQAYLLSQHNNLSYSLSFGIASIEMMCDFFKIYTKKEMYYECDNTFFLQLQRIINTLYFHLEYAYKQNSKMGEYKNIQNVLSIAYYKWLILFFSSFENEQRLNLLGYPFETYKRDLSLKFILLVQSKENYLDETLWKKLVYQWYHLPNLLFIKDQNEHWKKIYENFDSILKSNNIDKDELCRKK